MRRTTSGISQSDLQGEPPTQALPHTPSASGVQGLSSATGMSPLEALRHLTSVSDVPVRPVATASPRSSRNTPSTSGTSRIRQPAPSTMTPTPAHRLVTPPSASASPRARSSYGTSTAAPSGVSEFSRRHQIPHFIPTSPHARSTILSYISPNATPMSGFSEIPRVGRSASSVTTPLSTPSSATSASTSSRARSIISSYISPNGTPMSGFSEIPQVQRAASSVVTPTRSRFGSIEREALTQLDNRDDDERDGTHTQLVHSLCDVFIYHISDCCQGWAVCVKRDNTNSSALFTD